MSSLRRHPGALELLTVGVSTLGLCSLVATITGLAFASATRGLLAVQFVTLPHGPAQALSIFTHNARIMLTLIIVAFLARRAARSAGLPARVLLIFNDGCVIVAAAVQASLAGMLLGAYGMRQLEALMPYGPVEVTAWMLALSVYVRARRRPHTPLRTGGWPAFAFVLLAIAAMLEGMGVGV